EADAVFVPGRIAYNLVAPYREAEILEFPMTDDEERIRLCMEENADRIAKPARSGLAVFGILGDPNFFSTFSRLCGILRKRYPDIECTTEPGISSITAFASAAGISLSGGFVVSDGCEPDARILLKVRKPKEKMEELIREGYREFALVERMFMEDMKVYHGPDLPEKSDYMSVLYAKR
ncbi:MAG: cobalt-factor II C(20)-methyltransferase, partial [Methanoregulaceae archaeon]